tara:strand:- start:633 stop:764 length:132 start_codon:yes stop_codon:yes gene_type:complete
MIKTLAITFILFSIILSCGKKGDPVYKESKKHIKILNIQKNRI